MLKETPRAAARFDEGNRGEPSLNESPTLSALGINKKTSSVAQQLADMTDEQVQSIADREKSISQVLRAQLTIEKAGIGSNRSVFLQALTYLYAYCIRY